MGEFLARTLKTKDGVVALKRTCLLYWASLICMSFPARALELSQKITYYPDEFYQSAQLQTQNSTNLANLIYLILSKYHVTHQQGQDTLAEQCLEQNQDCYKHVLFSYNEARRWLFGALHLEQTKGQYNLLCVYCEVTYTNEDFPKGRGLGPNLIPDHKVLNAEHTWPQSRFNKKFSTELQKSDLHNLFPTGAKINRQRSNHPFGWVQTENVETCAASRLGESTNAATVFEPPQSHRGNVARAIFYFSLHYQTKITDAEEQTLREWHNQDPADDFELQRNEKIFEIQKVRNPFIDYPDLVQQINDF